MELARRAGLNQGYVSLIEKEARTPSPSAVGRLADALGIPRPVIELLAAEREELKGIDEDEATDLAMKLIQLVVSAEDQGNDGGGDENEDPDV